MPSKETGILTFSEDYYDFREFVVDPGQSPLRIDKFLLDRMQYLSRNRIQSAIKAGAVVVNEREVKPNYRVRPGDVIQVVIPKQPGEGIKVIPEDIPLNVVYEDEDLLVINKPAGLVVHPGVGNWRGTLVNALAYHFRDLELPLLDQNFKDRIGLVHRIDKNTSGLMVVAKTDFALNHLAKQFFRHSIERRYQALIWGEFEEDSGTIRGHIGRHPRNRILRTVFPEGDQGKWAVTHFRVLERLYYVSLVECQLETGRTHQIRVHMQYKGHPLFNDDRYGGDRICKGTVYSKYKQFVDNCFKILPRHALHAKVLGFVHPRTEKEIVFESDLPEDFATCLEKWRHYVDARRDKNTLT